MAIFLQSSSPTGRGRHKSLLQQVIRFAERATTPLLPADYVELFDPLRAAGQLRGRIVAIHVETADAVTIAIRPGHQWQGHTPGQYIRIGIDIEGIRQWRAYSLTNGPDSARGLIAITVKAIPGGLVSNHLVRQAQIGTLVMLDQAAGEFVVEPKLTTKTLFVTAGSGITPVMGILRNLGDGLEETVVVHSAPSAREVIFGSELRSMAKRGQIRLIEQHTDRDGMLNVAQIAALVPDYTERNTWACGPAGMLDAIEAHWNQADIAEQLTTERFRPNVLVTGEGGRVSFARSGVSVDADGSTPLLDAGEAADVLMPSGCRMGICFGCVVPLAEGAVRDLRNGEVTTAAPGDGVLIQTCISAAAGRCEIDL